MARGDSRYRTPRAYRAGAVAETGEEAEKMPMAAFARTGGAFMAGTS